MRAEAQAIHVIPWAQTEIDGIPDAPRAALGTGMPWRWHGPSLPLGGRPGLLTLGRLGRPRRARGVLRGRLLAAAEAAPDLGEPEDDPLPAGTLEVTDGRDRYRLAVVETALDCLLAATPPLPPRGAELWVLRYRPPRPPRHAPMQAGLLAGSVVDTPRGPVPVHALSEDDTVLTRDGAAQSVLWVGRRTLGGARLYLEPDLRPIRIRAGALGPGRPMRDLLVAPDQHMLVEGAAPRALFSQDAVLVAARDLVDDDAVQIDAATRNAVFVTLLLADHRAISVEGAWTESLHPGEADLSALDLPDRVRLIDRAPYLMSDPARFGPAMRRRLGRAEAAILRGGAV